MPVTAKPESVGLSRGRLALIRLWMENYLDAGKLPCALVLVARHGGIVFLETAGHRDVEAGNPLTEDTIFRIYSMTKPITSVAAMMLYEEGRFQLDDPVARYLPCFAEMEVHLSGEAGAMRTEAARQPVTIHHLLTHTSGLSYSFNETPVAALYQERGVEFDVGDGSLAETVERLAALPLQFEPGSRWTYSVSTDVLGRLVEVVSGQAFDAFLEERIFAPLGMPDTAFSVPAAKLDRFAAMYGPTADGGMELLEAPATSPFAGHVTMFSGGAGLVSTVSDFYRFTETLRCKGEFDGVRLLGRKTVEYMTANHLPGDLAAMGQAAFMETTMEGIGFGLGFSVMLDPATAQVVGSPGEYAWGGAASTAFWIDPVEDMTVIFMTQLMPSDTYPLRRELRVLTYQALID